MKKRFILSISLLLVALIFVAPVLGQDDSSDFIASKFDSPMLDLTNGEVDAAWTNISYYVSLPEYGDNGFVKFANNATHIFGLFHIDATLDWVAIEFGAQGDFCMVKGNDGWTFYINHNDNSVIAHDEIYKGSAGPPQHDSQNDLSYAAVLANGYFDIEVVRLFDTGDANDLTFANNDLWNVKFASSTHHAKGGLSNPTAFGPSDIYYLSVQTGSEIVIPDTPTQIDYDFWKMFAFIAIFVLSTAFVIAHFLVRQVFRPLGHPNPIVTNEFTHPTLKSRWNETFGKGTESSKKSGGKDRQGKVEA